MKLTLTALTIAATIFASSASAFDPDDLQKLKDTNECELCDLTDADLRSADLFKASLEDANLEGANLEDAFLEDANLEGAILCNTTMTMKVGVFAKLRAFFGQEPQVYYINDSGC